MSEARQWPEERSWQRTCERCNQPARVSRVVPEEGARAELWCLPCWTAYIDADPIPEDFPGRKALISAGHDSLQSVRALEDLTSVPGVGEATAAAITAALEDGES